MRRLNILLAAALVTLAGCQDPDGSRQEIPDGPASTFTLDGYTGNTITLHYVGWKRDVTSKSTEGTFPAGDAKRIIHSLELEGGAKILVGRTTKSGPITLRLSGDVPVLRVPDVPDSPVPIGTVAELQLLNTALDGHYRQEAPLDLLSLEWTPIGHAAPFTGTYDGNNISNLKISVDRQHAGLFGQVLDATIRNVHVTSGELSGPVHVGAICGLARGNTAIVSCSNAARVSGTGEEHGAAGICGQASAEGDARLSITDCHNTGRVKGCGISNTALATDGADITISACTNTAEVIGSGICGDAIANSSTISIIGCNNSGRVSGELYIGGICAAISANGGDDGSPAPFLSITACSNTGAIAGKESCTVGGIVGGMDSFSDSYTLGASITACYNTGRVSGKNLTGGICGETGQYSLVVASYNTGAITGKDAGGICGSIPVREITIAACYWTDVKGDDAMRGVALGGEDDGISKFSATAWPSAEHHEGWGTGNGDGPGKYWKSHGSWNNNKPIYPKLHFED
jgi:hypothetical protein